MKLPSREQVEALRREYPVGTLVELIHMDDVAAPPPGTIGEVVYVDDMCQLGVRWSNGSGLSLIPGVDSFRRVEK